MPIYSDRLLASAFGRKAMDLIAEGRYNRMTVWGAGRGCSKNLSDVIVTVRSCHQRGVCPSPVETDSTMVKVARSLGIYVGDPRYAARPQGGHAGATGDRSVEGAAGAIG